MAFYDERLQQLQQQVARKRQLTAQREELRAQRTTLNARVNELMGIKLSQQADVDKLEGRSLAAFFYNVVGKMDERLDKERQEAYAARVKYDAAARELAAAEDDLARCESELASLKNCETEYEALLRQKAAAIKSGGSAAAQEILKTEAHLAALTSQHQELQEAIGAGRSALQSAQQVLDSLDSAESWGTWDLWGGGGIITHLAKHDHLDSAQNQIEGLQSQLRRFKTELADVEIHADMQVSIDGFLRFADFFFDGLFADWTVLEQIKSSIEQVRATYEQINAVLAKLEAMLSDNERAQANDKAALDDLIRKSPV